MCIHLLCLAIDLGKKNHPGVFGAPPLVSQLEIFAISSIFCSLGLPSSFFSKAELIGVFSQPFGQSLLDGFAFDQLRVAIYCLHALIAAASSGE